MWTAISCASSLGTQLVADSEPRFCSFHTLCCRLCVGGVSFSYFNLYVTRYCKYVLVVVVSNYVLLSGYGKPICTSVLIKVGDKWLYVVYQYYSNVVVSCISIVYQHV